MSQNENTKKQYNTKWSDQEYLDYYFSKYPPYNEDAVMLAAVMAYEDAASKIGVSVIDIDTDDIRRAMTERNGLPVGADKGYKQSTTLAIYDNGIKTKTVERDGRVIHEYDAPLLGGSLKTFAGGGEVIGLNIAAHLSEAAAQLSKSTHAVISNKDITDKDIAIATNQEYRRLITAQTQDLTEAVSAAYKEVFMLEYSELKDEHEAKKPPASKMRYLSRKHPFSSEDEINNTYKNIVELPDNFKFLAERDTKDDVAYQMLSDMPDNEDALDKSKRFRQIAEYHNSVQRYNLETAVAVIAYTDDEHPLVKVYQEQVGEVRELNDHEVDRINVISPKSAHTGRQFFVPAIDVHDLEMPDTKPPMGGQYITDRSVKLPPKNTSIKGGVHVVSGDPTKHIDQIVLCEGIATAGSAKIMIDDIQKYGALKGDVMLEASKTEEFLKQDIDNSLEYFDKPFENKNIVLLSAYNVDNFTHIGKILHKNHPNTPIACIGDNDVHVKLMSGSGRPEYDKNGDMLYELKNDVDQELIDISTGNKHYIKASNLSDDPKVQNDILAINAGLKACNELNQYFIDNPNFNSDGDPMPPKAVAFAFDYGGNAKKSILPKVDISNDDIVMVSPHRDMNDVQNSYYRFIAHSIAHNISKDQGVSYSQAKKQVSREHVKTITNSEMFTKAVADPSRAQRQANTDIFIERLKNGQYQLNDSNAIQVYENNKDYLRADSLSQISVDVYVDKNIIEANLKNRYEAGKVSENVMNALANQGVMSNSGTFNPIPPAVQKSQSLQTHQEIELGAKVSQTINNASSFLATLGTDDNSILSSYRNAKQQMSQDDTAQLQANKLPSPAPR